MMRRLTYAFAILAVLSCVSCVRTLDSDWDGPGIELTLTCDDSPLETKAGINGTRDGVDRYNENLIDMVDFFFYPGEEPDRTADATFHVRLQSGKRYSDVFRIELTSEDVNTRIFPTYPDNVRKATVFAVVNYPGRLVYNETTLAGTSLDELESILMTTDFVSPEDHRQDKFVMSGTSVINLRGRSQIMAAIGSIDLARYACKMTVGVSVAERVELPNHEVWSPMLEGMEIYLVNAVKTVTLGGEDETPSYFSYSSNRKRFVNKDELGNLTPIVGKDGDYYSTYPMYMYPQRWTYGSSEGYDREPYLKLVVPWVRHAENGFAMTEKQLYYKIVMPDDTREGYRRRFIRNNWYHLDIDVGILGAETDEASVTIDPMTVYMVYWQNDEYVSKKVEIGNARYLSVEKEYYELNNVNSVEVDYTTSHPAIIKEGSIRVTRPYYGEATSGQALGGVIRQDTNGELYRAGSYYLEYDQAHREAMNNGLDWFENTGTCIRYTHDLQNDYRLTSFEYSPYTVSFTIVHEDLPDDMRYSKDITLVQYPAIFIEATPNSDDTFVVIKNGTDNRKLYTSDHWGYVYVDNEHLVRQGEGELEDYAYIYQPLGYTAEDYHWRAIWYTGGSRDIFKMNVTVLPPNSEFVIGDPRSKTVDNLRTFHDAPSVEGTTRTLTWYYPSESSDRTANMMAPGYRVASKCGGVEFGPITMEQAKLRCASFQEDGFPAGRWRRPTKAEIHFIAQLSANGAFTFLFSSAVYWSANGAVRVNRNNGTVTDVSDQKALVRCVYDTWYWGDEQQEDRSQFVWGDRQR